MSHYISRSEGEGRQISAERNAKKKTPGGSLLFHMTSSSLSVVLLEVDIWCSPASRFVPDSPGRESVSTTYSASDYDEQGSVNVYVNLFREPDFSNSGEGNNLAISSSGS